MNEDVIDWLWSLDDATFEKTVQDAIDRANPRSKENLETQQLLEAAAYLCGIRGLDGRYSRQTVDLVARFNAKGFAFSACCSTTKGRSRLVRLAEQAATGDEEAAHAK